MSDYDDDFEQDESSADAADPIKRKFRQLADARRERDMAKQAEKRAEERYRSLEAEIVQMVEDSGMKGKWTFDFGGELGTISFQRKSTIYGRVLDLNTALETLEQEALVDEMTVPKIESRRLNEYVRDRLENGQEPGDGIDFYERKFVSISGMGGD